MRMRWIRWLLLTLFISTFAAALFLPVGTLAAPNQGTNAANQGRGEYQNNRMAEMQDLIWLLAGIKQMDKDPKLRLTEKQAKEILPVIESLVKQKIIQLESTTNNQQSAPQNMTDAEREKLRKQRQEQVKAIRSAIDKIEKVLTDRQIQFVDDFDFRPEDYGLGGFGSWQGFDRQNPPISNQRETLREEARKRAERLVMFNKDFLTFLRTRAKASAKS